MNQPQSNEWLLDCKTIAKYLSVSTAKRLTQKLIEGGNMLDIAVLNHFIIMPRVYLSFADGGLMF